MGLAAFYDRAVLPRLLTFACGTRHIADLRREVVPLAHGRVFEIGCGGGLNQPFYNRDSIDEFAGIDPHEGLLEQARKKAHALGWKHDLRAGVGEDIPFASSSFDVAVCTYTLCSVREPNRVLAELARVLKPGGRLLFLEHGRAPDAEVVKWQKRMEPIWKPLAGGCHLTRPVGASIRAAGLHVAPFGQRYLAHAPRAVGWMEWGVAHKPG